MDSDELDFQLKCEALEKNKKATAANVALSLSDASGTYVDPKDGAVYEWDENRKAWFPKIDADFIAMYQASYGSYDAETAVASASSSTGAKVPRPVTSVDDDDVVDYRPPVVTPRPNKKQKKEKESKEGFASVQKAEKNAAKKKEQEAAAWFDIDDEHNRNVYVSNLPADISTQEFVDLMSKCGIVMKDPRTDTYKVKIYKDAEGVGKGDALCTYMKIESVPLALQILDGYQFNANTISVERAKFDLKGAFNVDTAKKRRLKKNEKKRMQKAESKLLDWRPDKLPGIRAKNEKIVVIKNMFDPKEFEADPSLLLEFKQDIQSECEKFGEVKKVAVYDRHPEGVVTVGFAEFEHADACITRMNGRWFDQRQLVAEQWDGKTKYKIEESAEEEQKRLGQWQKFLDQSDTSTPVVQPT